MHSLRHLGVLARYAVRAMTREQAIQLARRFAKAKPQSYYSEPFQPHEWVIDAIVAAYLKGCYENKPEVKPK
jgi:hypothetical protein